MFQCFYCAFYRRSNGSCRKHHPASSAKGCPDFGYSYDWLKKERASWTTPAQINSSSRPKDVKVLNRGVVFSN